MLFEIIFIIIIIVVIQNAKKKKRDGNRTNSNASYGVRPPQPYQQQNYQQMQMQLKQPQHTQRRPMNMTTAQQRKPASAKPIATKAVRPEDDTTEHSTTEYLQQKAMEDQREHAVEKAQEKKRLQEKYGLRAVAMRYLPGDRIPQGMRIVYCSYCNAENLVETIRTDRACYFCRTKL